MKLFGNLFLVAAFALPITALADDGAKASAELRKQMLDLSKSVSGYSNALGRSLNSLETVRNADAKKLPKAFASFRKDSQNLDSARQHAESQLDAVSKKRVRYFSEWDKSINSISNPELKKTSMDRRQKMMTDHARLTTDAQTLRQQVSDFMTKQQELRKFFGTDTSVGAVTAAKGTIDEILRAGRSLAPGVNDTSRRLLDFGAGRE
jgi:uncharacterized protein YhaN